MDSQSPAALRRRYIVKRLGCYSYWNGQDYVLGDVGPGSELRWSVCLRDWRRDEPNCDLLPVRVWLAVRKANLLFPNPHGPYRRTTYLSLKNERRRRRES